MPRCAVRRSPLLRVLSACSRAPPRFLLSRCAPSATDNCSPLRRKCRRPSAGLFFGLRGSLLSCSRAPPRFLLSRCAPSATDNCSPLRRKFRRPSAGLFFGLRGSLLSCSRAPPRFLLYPISGQKERGAKSPLLFAYLLRLGGGLHLHIRWGRRNAPHLGQVVTPGVSSFHTELRRLFRRCLDTLLLGTAMYDTSLGSCPGRAKLTHSLYPTAAQGQQNVDHVQACSRRIPR